MCNIYEVVPKQRRCSGVCADQPLATLLLMPESGRDSCWIIPKTVMQAFGALDHPLEMRCLKADMSHVATAM